MFAQCMFFFVLRQRNVSPNTCAASVLFQCPDEFALVTRVCVQLLLQREATLPSSVNQKRPRRAVARKAKGGTTVGGMKAKRKRRNGKREVKRKRKEGETE